MSRQLELPLEWPEVPVEKKRQRLKLNASSLRQLADAMDLAHEQGIGTFHMLVYANRKVKYDSDYGEHCIYWE